MLNDKALRKRIGELEAMAKTHNEGLLELVELGKQQAAQIIALHACLSAQAVTLDHNGKAVEGLHAILQGILKARPDLAKLPGSDTE